jgi:signal transduction histidine kinase
MYLANTALITGAASLQMGMNPVRFWWMGTRENGPAEVALMAVGLVGAMAYRENPWTIVALIVPTAIIYVAFSGLARANTRLEEAAERLKALQGQIATNAKLASVGAISLDIAHQIKNPLTILLGHLESLESCLASDDPCQRHVTIATTAGDRINKGTYREFYVHGISKAVADGPA